MRIDHTDLFLVIIKTEGKVSVEPGRWGGGGGEHAALFQADNKGLEPVFEHPVILILRVGHKDDHLRAIGQTWAQAHAFVVGQ